jgi:hypothetical protein
MATRRFVAVGLLVAAALLAILLSALTAVSRAGPSTLDAGVVDRIALSPGDTIQQSFYMPACPARAIAIALARPAPAAGRVTLELLVADDRRWPDRLVFSAPRAVPAGATRLIFELPALADARRRLMALHLSVEAGPSLLLDTRRPPTGWRGALRAGGAWRGREAVPFEATSDAPRAVTALACAFGVDDRPRAWLVTLGVLAIVIGVAVVAGYVASPPVPDAAGRRAPYRAGWSLAPMVVAAASGLTWLSVVPGYEGPDEVAHVQYARYIAAERALPSGIPPQDSPWTLGAYEWVQPPVSYVAAAAVLRWTDAVGAAPVLPGNPLSVAEAGPERTLFRHGTPQAGSHFRPLLWLRLLNVTYTVLTIYLAAHVIRRHVGGRRLAAAATCALALVPQWSAILAMAGNDAPATLLATATFVLLLDVATGPARPLRMLVAGGLVGLSLGTKLTTAFLIPTAIVACCGPALRERRHGCAWLAFGALAASGWIYVRQWVVFGDPLASDFKRDLLDRSGFITLAAAQPRVTDTAFWVQLHAQVYEAFWARFGSLGAGPDAGSRVWWIFAGLSVLVAALVATGLAVTLRARSDESRWLGLTTGTAFLSGIAIWIGVNVAGRPDMIVHWTPRHVLPLSVVALALASTGARWCHARHPRMAPVVNLIGAFGLALLAAAWLVSWRHAMQQFHFGYL